MSSKLKDLIALGEGFSLEFKRRMSSNLGQEICAFANSSGGKILIGVDDDGSIVGVNDCNKLRSDIQNTARNLDPSLVVDIAEEEGVVIITIPEGRGKPYSVGGKFYVREGANSQQLKRDEISEFFYREGLILFDEKPHFSFDIDKDFSQSKFNKFLELSHIPSGLDTHDTLMNLKLIEDEKMKNAGVWLFGNDVRDYFLSATITCVLFQGNSKTKILDRKEFDGDIHSNYVNATNYLLSHLNTEFIIKTGPRIERLELPEEALREALLNAIAHRDYRSTANIQIYIFKDRVEIVNPGGLVAGLSEDQLERRSMPRNPLLFGLMHRMHMVEQIGSGIKRINDSLRGYDMDKPLIENDETWFSITFPRLDKNTVPPKTQVETPGLILHCLKDSPQITLAEVASIINKLVASQVGDLSSI